jgi:hypothetical protein
MSIVSSPEEFIEVALTDLDITLTGGQTLNLTLRPDDERTDFTDAIKVTQSKLARWCQSIDSTSSTTVRGSGSSERKTDERAA